MRERERESLRDRGRACAARNKLIPRCVPSVITPRPSLHPCITRYRRCVPGPGRRRPQLKRAHCGRHQVRPLSGPARPSPSVRLPSARPSPRPLLTAKQTGPEMQQWNDPGHRRRRARRRPGAAAGRAGAVLGLGPAIAGGRPPPSPPPPPLPPLGPGSTCTHGGAVGRMHRQDTRRLLDRRAAVLRRDSRRRQGAAASDGRTILRAVFLRRGLRPRGSLR